MNHLPNLITDLALILVAAAFVTIIFKKIKQPLVLGYIIAGFLVSPHFQWFPTVQEGENIKIWADIGVIFLLFGLGLEFSFKKLVRVGGSASITAFVEIIFITITGYLVGRWMGWSTMDSLFLGGMLASSSTTIIIRAFDELGIKTKHYAKIVFGVLIVEDIVVILLMVLLSTMAVSQRFEGSEMAITVIKLLFFLALWFITGIFLLPSFLKRARKLMDEETLLVLSIGLCLAMVVIATNVGFSAELGAFIMGSIIAETTSAEKVEHIIKPVKNLFGAVFFVSVGMMIDPKAIIEYGLPVLAVTFLTLFGKLFSTTLGALLSGQPLKQSVQVGMSMAQIGEFAFIVATLGLSLGVISDFLFPVAVGASAITTFTTPYMIKFSGPFYSRLVQVLPKRWTTALNAYSTSTQNIQADSDWKVVIKAYINIAVTNGIVLLALMLLSINFLVPFLSNNMPNSTMAGLIALVISLIAASPFIWAFMAKKPENMAYKELWLNRKYNHGPLLVLETLRIVLGVLIIGVWVDRLFSTGAAILVVVPVFIVVLIVFSKKLKHFYYRIEGRFLSNLNARELAAEKKQQANSEKYFTPQTDLSPWDAHMISLQVPQLAVYAGKTLVNLAWREKFGINIAYIKRGDQLIYAPGRYNMLLPFDQVGIIATDEQMQQFTKMFEATTHTGSTEEDLNDIILHKIEVNEHTRLKGKTIRDSAIRERTNGLVVGIERNTERMLNPDSSTVFEWGDIVWIVGERKKIYRLHNDGTVNRSSNINEQTP